MSFTQPGFQAVSESHEDQIWAQGPDHNHQRFLMKQTIASATVDAGNTPTSTLRHGCIFGLTDSTGKAGLYDADGNLGLQNVIGVNEQAIDMLGRNGVAVDQMKSLLTGGIFKDITQLVGYDKAAAATLFRMGFTNAGAVPHGSMFGLHFKARYFKNGTTLAGAYTVLDSDHGCMLVATTAAMNFTLPSLATVGRGFQVFLYNAVDANMVITGAANTIITGDAGGALSTTITFSTANAKMGSHALMYADYGTDEATLQWYALMVNRTPTTA